MVQHSESETSFSSSENMPTGKSVLCFCFISREADKKDIEAKLKGMNEIFDDENERLKVRMISNTISPYTAYFFTGNCETGK